MAYKLFAVVISLALAAMLCSSASAFTILRRRPSIILPPVSGAQLRLARAGISVGPLPPVLPVVGLGNGGYVGVRESYGDAPDPINPYDNDNYRLGGGYVPRRRVVYDTPDVNVNDYGQIQVSY